MNTPVAEGGSWHVARVVSIALHPFAVFAALSLVSAWQLDPAALPHAAIGIAIAIGVVWLFVLQRRRAGYWQTVDASRRQERPLLYLLALAVALAYWAWMGGAASPASGGVLSAVAMICIAGIANRWIKLSLHMASLAFASVVLLALLPAVAGVAIGLLPLLAWARVRMTRHTWPEVVGGTLLGALLGACVHWLG